jgi:hypothetical protein
MKRITEIEFVNYKAFYNNGEENRIVIPEGKNVLLYGENGTDTTIEVIPSRHIAVAKSRIEEGALPGEAEKEVLTEVAVKVTFSDSTGSEQKVFGAPVSNTQGANYIAQANLLNGFLSYRELLRTYLMDDLRDRTEFRRKFANLLIENILARQINSVTRRPYISSWEALFIPKRRYKEESLQAFSDGLQFDINRINLVLNEILRYFEPDLHVHLFLESMDIEYVYSNKHDRFGKYPICEIDLGVKLFDIDTENEDENHLTVLNEARLSALAISIYLASLINTPQDGFDFKILFLDDIFIGLDMSNRLPLLEIIKEFKKPIIEQSVDADNKIITTLRRVNGVIQTEADPFFLNYQIFISTYDRSWFEVAKRYFETKSKDQWCYQELFVNRKPELAFNTPRLYNSLNYLQKAEYYYQKHDYPSCANHLRKALESRIKELLPPNEHYGEFLDGETGVTEIKKLKSLSQYLERFIAYCGANEIDATELADLKNLKDWYLNPFSHDNIETPIFKRELDIARTLVKDLDRFEFHILLKAGINLCFRFDDGAGQTREYKVELQENLRWIKSVDGNMLTNPLVRCYEWTRNGQVERPAWAASKLRHFYNNKWRGFIKRPEIPDFPMETYWSEIYQDANNQPLLAAI